MGTKSMPRSAANGPSQRAVPRAVPRGGAVTEPLQLDGDDAGAAAAAAYYDFFLSYSADFASGQPNPPGSGYHWSLQQSRFGLSAAFQARLEERQRRA